MTEWGRTSAPGRPPSRRAWFFFGLLFGAAAAAGGAFALYPDFIISPKQDTGRLEARIVELEAELARARQGSDAPKSESDAALAGKYDALARLADEQAGQVRELTGRLEFAEQLNGELQAALDKAPSGDVELLRGQLAERDDLLAKIDAELVAMEKRAAELESERDRLKADILKAGAPKAISPDPPGGGQEAQKKLDAATGEIAGLKSALGERDKALGELDAEIARLAKFESEAAELRRALAGNSGRTASLTREELEKTNRIRLEGELTIANREFLASQAKLDQAQKTIASNEKLLGERDKALGELDAEIARLAKFEAEAAELRKALTFNAGKASISPGEAAEKANRVRLERELATANGDLLALQAKLNHSQETIAANERAFASSGKSAADASAKLDKELGAAKSEIASLKTELARLTAEAAAKIAKTAEPEKAAGPQKATPLKERDPVLVAGAMAQAKGLENLDANARDRIGTGLIEGECVAKVLSDVFGKPPALAMRDLIRALDSDC